MAFYFAVALDQERRCHGIELPIDRLTIAMLAMVPSCHARSLTVGASEDRTLGTLAYFE